MLKKIILALLVLAGAPIVSYCTHSLEPEGDCEVLVGEPHPLTGVRPAEIICNE